MEQLWQQARYVSSRALKTGALQQLNTDYDFVEDRGVRFIVRVLATLEAKRRAATLGRMTEASGRNPFLPYDEALFVAEVSNTHVCLLNKFNVIDHHLLLVTRTFEHQDTPLDIDDFEAIVVCLGIREGLAFYNGGQIAGASQEHKHLQWVPVPLVPEIPKLPIETILQTADEHTSKLSRLPFAHSFIDWQFDSAVSARDQARWLLSTFETLRRATGYPDGPYNLLVARSWMLVVPRSKEALGPVQVNSLGFAGSLLVRNSDDKEFLRKTGPFEILKAVSCPPK